MENKKLAALTFDDGPVQGITDKVLDVLDENGVTASFFLIGNNITDTTAPLVKRAHDMGCSIENHSRTHSAMTTLTEQEILDEISYTSDVIERITGDKPQFFRPPYIDYNKKMYDIIDLTFICGCEDWLVKVSASERVQRILAQAKPGFIILMHDMQGNVQTVEAIKTIIPELKKQGYEFVTIRNLFKKSGVVSGRNTILMEVK